MEHYAFLCGSAPQDMRQKKLVEMYDFLTTSSEHGIKEKNVVMFPNGVNSFLLSYGLNNILKGKAGKNADQILLYFCTQSPVRENDSSLWLSGSEIKKSEIEELANSAKAYGVDFQIIFDVGKELVSERELGYE